ncbi:MAG: hypothetical protein RR954_00710 [Christensenellaceae bacterium]
MNDLYHAKGNYEKALKTAYFAFWLSKKGIDTAFVFKVTCRNSEYSFCPLLDRQQEQYCSLKIHNGKNQTNIAMLCPSVLLNHLFKFLKYEPKNAALTASV